MAEMATTAEVMTTADGTPLKVSIARAMRHKKITAALMVAPLFLFILFTFLIPIFDMTFRSVENSLVSRILHRTTPLLKEWDHSSGELPSEEIFAALVADIAEGRETREIGKVGTRLNYEIAGMSSLFRTTSRKAKKLEAPFKESLIDVKEGWGDIATWNLLKRESGKFTGAVVPLLQQWRRKLAGIEDPAPHDAIAEGVGPQLR